MKINVEGKATVDIHIEDMSYDDAHRLVIELRRLESMLPDEYPQSVKMFMDALGEAMSFIRSGRRIYEDEEL